jgi:hypothetical protein
MLLSETRVVVDALVDPVDPRGSVVCLAYTTKGGVHYYYPPSLNRDVSCY